MNFDKYVKRDKKGVYGIKVDYYVPTGFSGYDRQPVTEKERTKKAKRYIDYIIRPDKAATEYEYDKGLKVNSPAILSTLPRGLRGVPGDALEIRIKEKLYRKKVHRINFMKEIASRDVARFKTQSSEVVGAITNNMLKQVLAVADPESLRVARRFHPKYRLHLYRACCRFGQRVQQILEVFPLLGLKIFYPEQYQFNREEALQAVLDGTKLKLIAELTGTPMVLRKIKPGAIHPRCGLSEYEKIMEFCPRTTHKQRLWVASTMRFMLFLFSGKEEVVRWWAKNIVPFCITHRHLFDTEDLYDYIHADGVDIGLFGLPKFNTKMSFQTVKKLSEKWHIRLSRYEAEQRQLRCKQKQVELQQLRTQILAPYWVSPFYGDEYNIVPLVTIPDLEDEGAAMHNCVGSYWRFVQDGRSNIYSVRKNGDIVATLELVKNNGEYEIQQLKGQCNSDVSDDIKRLIRRWLRQYGGENVEQSGGQCSERI